MLFLPGLDILLVCCNIGSMIDESIDNERQKSEDIARLINDYQNAAEKAIMNKVTDSIDKTEVVKLPDDFKPPTILSGEKNKK